MKWREAQGDPTNREIVWWSVEEQERLTHETMEAAVEDFLNLFALRGWVR
jgi:hypothetical protein